MRWLTGIGGDLRQAVRALRVARAFTLTAILTLATGIGANTAVFSVVNALLFRPLPVRAADRLIVLASTKSPSRSLRGLSYPELEDYEAGTARTLEPIAGYTVGFAGVTPEHGTAARALVAWVTGHYFSLLGLAPAAGRLIDEHDVTTGRVSPLVVLGYDSWTSRFGADPSVVGRKVLINGGPCTIVGIAPRGFSGTFAFADPELYLPMNWSNGGTFDDRTSRNFHTLSRLRPGVSIEQANAQLDVVSRRLEAEHPDTSAGVRVTAIPERFARPEEDNARSNRFGATVILLLVALVFFAAEVNVMNLLIARAASRRRELAIRVAVGASRGRVFRQLAVETALLAIAGGAMGLLLACWITSALSAVSLPGSLPVRLDFGVDTRVLVFAFALTCMTAATVGVLVALRASRVNVDLALRDRGGDLTWRSRRHGLRTGLVITQTAACFVLLVAGAMFTRSLGQARQMNLGFDPRGVLNIQMDVAQVGYSEARGRVLLDEIERRVRRLPGVDDVSYACTVPIGYVRLTGRVAPSGSSGGSDRVSAGMNIVGPDYFRVMRIPLERGRAFDERDTERAPRVAIVNSHLASALWPGENPIGRQFQEAPESRALQVVGVAAISKYRLLFEDPQPYFYVPSSQRYSALRVLHVRSSSRPPESLAPEVAGIVRELEPALPLYDVQTMADALNGGYGFFLVRAAAVFSLVLAALGATLALVGLYGVVSCAVTERSREIGIRLALGATTGAIARMVVTESAMLGGTGALVGAASAAAVARIIAGVLYGVTPADPLSFAAAAAGLVLVTLIAASGPAVRAMSTDPIAALRTE